MPATWTEIRPDRLRRDGEFRRRAFRSGDASLDVWLDAEGCVARWQAAWSEPREPDRIVEWRAGGGLRTGTVVEDDRAFSMYKGAPLVRFDAAPRAEVLAEARKRIETAALPPEAAGAVRAAWAA